MSVKFFFLVQCVFSVSKNFSNFILFYKILQCHLNASIYVIHFENLAFHDFVTIFIVLVDKEHTQKLSEENQNRGYQAQYDKANLIVDLLRFGKAPTVSY